ncbi:torsin-1A-like [Centruroides sculpturatus]|uniref:torsin-1A-like n=1 Tax=Centruroides sculpturatus TaxID=218467 RepID=UPI000C6D1D29|nr:torsin-1A-like [Centruroides sculpturatus]
MICAKTECCTDNWRKANFSNLSIALTSTLHGQHLVKQILLPSIRGHLIDNDPKKALVLSFHGGTGVGKNFVTRLIAENLYVQGMKSKYFHLFIHTRDFKFASEPNKLNEYKRDLELKIYSSVASCESSLFIFDEADMMPAELIDVIKPYVDNYNDIEGINFRRAIFIFLNNAGSEAIENLTRRVWEKYRKRIDITLKDVEPLIVTDLKTKEATNVKVGLYESSIMKSHLIDTFVPFLPLEKEHVKLCIKDDLNSKGHAVDPKVIEEIAEELNYFPEGTTKFSKSGCRKISQKVNMRLFDEL